MSNILEELLAPPLILIYINISILLVILMGMGLCYTIRRIMRRRELIV